MKIKKAKNPFRDSLAKNSHFLLRSTRKKISFHHKREKQDCSQYYAIWKVCFLLPSKSAGRSTARTVYLFLAHESENNSISSFAACFVDSLVSLRSRALVYKTPALMTKCYFSQCLGTMYLEVPNTLARVYALQAKNFFFFNKYQSCRLRETRRPRVVI